MKQLVISRGSLETRVAFWRKVAGELYVERPGLASLVGNIYNGRVENVLAGMDAAFVDIGLERNGFLYVDEVTGGAGRARPVGTRSPPAAGGQRGLGPGGPRCHGEQGTSPHHSAGLGGALPGVPAAGATVGASRRLEERNGLACAAVCQARSGPGRGTDIRTAAEGAGEKAIARELRFLRTGGGGVERRAAACSAPALVYA